VSARCRTIVGSGSATACSDVYARLSLAILQGDKARARQIYYDEILPDRRFSHGEVLRLSYRIGVIDEGDQYLASGADPAAGAPDALAVRPSTAAGGPAPNGHRPDAAARARPAEAVNGRGADAAAREGGIRFDRKIQVERVAAMLIPGEVVDAVFDMKGGCTGFVGITNRRVIIHDRAFLHRHEATVSIPYSKISSVAAKEESGRWAGRACWASCELILTTGAGDFELEFRGAEKAHQAHCLILQHLI